VLCTEHDNVFLLHQPSCIYPFPQLQMNANAGDSDAEEDEIKVDVNSTVADLTTMRLEHRPSFSYVHHHLKLTMQF
jgi:hypothetical protein